MTMRIEWNRNRDHFARIPAKGQCIAIHSGPVGPQMTDGAPRSYHWQVERGTDTVGLSLIIMQKESVRGCGRRSGLPLMTCSAECRGAPSSARGWRRPVRINAQEPHVQSRPGQRVHNVEQEPEVGPPRRPTFYSSTLGPHGARHFPLRTAKAANGIRPRHQQGIQTNNNQQ